MKQKLSAKNNALKRRTVNEKYWNNIYDIIINNEIVYNAVVLNGTLASHSADSDISITNLPFIHFLILIAHRS